MKLQTLRTTKKLGKTNMFSLTTTAWRVYRNSCWQWKRLTKSYIYLCYSSVYNFILMSYLHGCLGFFQKPTVRACILPKSSIRLRQNTCLHSGLLQKPPAPMQGVLRLSQSCCVTPQSCCVTTQICCATSQGCSVMSQDCCKTNLVITTRVAVGAVRLFHRAHTCRTGTVASACCCGYFPTG